MDGLVDRHIFQQQSHMQNIERKSKTNPCYNNEFLNIDTCLLKNFKGLLIKLRNKKYL